MGISSASLPSTSTSGANKRSALFLLLGARRAVGSLSSLPPFLAMRDGRRSRLVVRAYQTNTRTNYGPYEVARRARMGRCPLSFGKQHLSSSRERATAMTDNEHEFRLEVIDRMRAEIEYVLSAMPHTPHCGGGCERCELEDELRSLWASRTSLMKSSGA